MFIRIAQYSSKNPLPIFSSGHYWEVWSICQILPKHKTKQKKITQNQPVTLPKKTDQNAEKFAASNYKKPLSFEPNKGQTDSRVKFLAQGFGYNLFLTSNEAVMSFNKSDTFTKKGLSNSLTKIPQEMPEKSPDSVLRMKFIDANANPNIEANEELPGKRNYLSDKQKIINL